MTLTEEEKKIILGSIRDIPDFPKPGIIFKDITTLLGNANAFDTLMNHLTNRYKSYDLDYVAGIDARGFIFGAALAVPPVAMRSSISRTFDGSPA